MSSYRVVLIGEGGVGKSCITIQFINERFVEEYDPTLEDSYRKQVTVDDREYLLDIFDTAGQEDFSAVRDQYMRTGDGFLCVYAITLPHSFNKVRDFFDHVRRVKDTDKFPLIILGNKCDLESERKVSLEEGQALADEMKCLFMETSAKTPLNVDEAFHTVVREINKFRESNPQLQDKQSKKKPICNIL